MYPSDRVGFDQKAGLALYNVGLGQDAGGTELWG